MHAELVFVILFAVATAVAVAARWFKLPYTVALVVAGLVLGLVDLFPAPHLTQDLLFAIFLPGLLFEAAFHLPFDGFLKNKRAVSALAFPGVAVSVGLTALILAPVVTGLHVIEGFQLIHAAVFAALIAATDPIAVVGLFKTLGAPRRLSVLVEGESLLNDGTGVVVFTLMLSIALGQATTWDAVLLEFIKVTGGGLLLGAVFGYLGSKVVARIDEPMIEITLTMIAAYGSFVVAEQAHVSGVIATVVAGMFFGNYAARHGMSPTTRVAVESFWEYLAFALNSFVFLLIGMEVKFTELLAYWKVIVIAWVAVMAARYAVVFAVTALLRWSPERIPWRWSAVLGWSGLRGALSMVLVLALPKTFPHRDLLVHMTFGVVLISILAQGLSMAPVLRWLKVVKGKHKERQDYELWRGKLKAAHAALEELDQIGHEHAAHPEILEGLRTEYRQRIQDAQEHLSALQADTNEFREEEEREARRRVLTVEKDALLRQHQKGVVGEHALQQLLGELNHQLDTLDADDGEPR